MTPQEIEKLQKENERIKEELNLFKVKHKHFTNKVKEMMDCQQAYFKSNKDFQLLKKSKMLEAEIRDIINPKPVKQQTFDWLAQ